ncbi:LAMI_0G03840g1_1 [Lachancea mirantina]|uniref:HECT-type E3 ubiquitin transferase n=1 Tax=Lachancea mirantina TaxID=1230905 RepID=A0A1G4K893_9SACH|nr:LAMI_0G03840g1_1 [Lachancea mirantina]
MPSDASPDHSYDEDGDFFIEEEVNGIYHDEMDDSEYQSYSYGEEDELEEETYDGEEANETVGSDETRMSFRNAEHQVHGNGARNISRHRLDSGRPSTLHELLHSLAYPSEEGLRHDYRNNGINVSGRLNFAELLPEMLNFVPDAGRSRSTANGMMKLIGNIEKAEQDTYLALESLRNISEQLLMLNPLTAERVIPQDDLLATVLRLLSNPQLQEELELQLAGCRCLYNIFEVNPEMIAVAVDDNAIDVLRDKLLEINYIDLAEQVLETLEFISRINGQDILESGCLVACMQYMDFFTTHAQRKVVAIVANSCARAKDEDYDEMQEVFPLLKTVFINSSDQVISNRSLDAVYGICQGVADMGQALESFFDLEVMQRLMHIVSISEFELDSKLKALDILSQLVLNSSKLSTDIIFSEKVPLMLEGCINQFRKTSDSALHETLMFVPKPLLTSVSRFLVLLLPVEDFQLLTTDNFKKPDVSNLIGYIENLAAQVTPVLVEIYTNSIDFEIRKYVLLALLRICSSLEPAKASVLDDNLVGMLASTLAQNKSIYESSNGHDYDAGFLLLGILCLVLQSATKFSARFFPAFKREGVFDVLKSLSDFIAGSEARQENAAKDKFEEKDDVDSASDSDDGDAMSFNATDIPPQVTPRKLVFKVFRKMAGFYIFWKISDLTAQIMSLRDNTVSKAREILDVEEWINHMKEVSLVNYSSQNWANLWADVKSLLFSETFTISSFELVSTGMVSAMWAVISRYPNCQKEFQEGFGKGLPMLVEALQSAITRLETLPITECGLPSEEGRAASLGKQVKIRLEFEKTGDEYSPPANLHSVVICIHCVASFRALNDFLRHRILQSQLLTSLTIASSSNRKFNAEEWKDKEFEFFVDGKPQRLSETIFSAVFKSFLCKNEDISQKWGETQVITYRITDLKSSVEESSQIYANDISEVNVPTPLKDVLGLLSFCRRKDLPADLFINSKLSAKLSRQLEEPLIVAGGILPPWTLYVTKYYSFLFPIETRMFFLQSTSFGYGRLIQLWRQRTGDDKASGETTLQQLGRPGRHKLRISRENAFLSALKILAKYGSTPNMLEVEYQNEVGSGLGPTLEFYATISKEFAKKSHLMWRRNDYGLSGSDNFETSLLFPAPLANNADSPKILELFEHLGNFVSRSMLDNRILDFRFSEAFFQLAHTSARGDKVDLTNRAVCLDLLHLVDPQIEKSIAYLLDQKNASEVENLALTFYLSGYDIELVTGGKNIVVTSENLEVYLEKLLDQLLGSGVQKQIQSFIDGFSRAFPYASLLIFSPAELTNLFGMIEEDWTTETLYSYINADHGYTMDSVSIHDFVSILSDFIPEERRLFLQFLTGSPKLPIGGFESLNPKFTVVMKHADEGMQPDHYLPSVMTCANYLKLPKYSSKSVMRSRIIQAMKEGGNAFLLS